MLDLQLSGKAGCGEFMVAEADEYDERFLQLRPYIAVVTNIDADHLDFYGNMDKLVHAFERFAGAIVPGGHLVACGRTSGRGSLAETRPCSGTSGWPVATLLLYGFAQSARLPGD